MEFDIGDNMAVQIYKSKDGQEYHNIKSKIVREGVYCKNRTNQVLLGYPRIVLRKGNNNFGEQIYFQFWILEGKEEYQAKTDWENMEWYFSADAGILFLEKALAYIKSIRGGDVK